jgi:hypothetical protein
MSCVFSAFSAFGWFRIIINALCQALPSLNIVFSAFRLLVGFASHDEQPCAPTPIL